MRRPAESGRIVSAADSRDKYLTNLGFEPTVDTPDQFAAFLKTDIELARRSRFPAPSWIEQHPLIIRTTGEQTK